MSCTRIPISFGRNACIICPKNLGINKQAPKRPLFTAKLKEAVGSGSPHEDGKVDRLPDDTLPSTGIVVLRFISDSFRVSSEKEVDAWMKGVANVKTPCLENYLDLLLRETKRLPNQHKCIKLGGAIQVLQTRKCDSAEADAAAPPRYCFTFGVRYKLLNSVPCTRANHERVLETCLGAMHEYIASHLAAEADGYDGSAVPLSASPCTWLQQLSVSVIKWSDALMDMDRNATELAFKNTLPSSVNWILQQYV